MSDGDLGAMPGATVTAPAIPPPPRFCSDCTREPLAFWTLDDCNTSSTQLNDSAFTSSIPHPAFRAVSVACVAGASSQAVKLAGTEDIVYAPDQPDFIFDQGLTIAAWVKANSLNGTQSIVRKRFAGTSSFTLAIDDKKLSFVVRLTNGKLVGVTAAIKADRLIHVAATYDGQRAQLYIDGALAAKTNGSGKIAAGAGPILIGNDADGRQFKGIIDEIWLNTLAAPADAVKGLTCIRKAPVVKLTPAQSPATPPNSSVAFDLSVKNPSGASCPVDSFQFFAVSVPFPLPPIRSSASCRPGPARPRTPRSTYPRSTQARAGRFRSSTSSPTPRTSTCRRRPTRRSSSRRRRRRCAPGARRRRPRRSRPAATTSTATPCARGKGVPTPFTASIVPRWSGCRPGEHISLADFQLMATWNANVVRIALNQDFWLAGSQYFDPSYIDLARQRHRLGRDGGDGRDPRSALV